METLRLHFRRDRDFTGGYDNCAWCITPDGVKHSISRKPYKNKRGSGFAHGVGDKGHGGVVYRLIIKLADAGWLGYPFEGHDGRIVAYTGVIDRTIVPTSYGGQRKTAPEGAA